jgi:ribosomal protein L11 methylase PrmA
VCDIGCSAGVLCYIAKFLGYEKAYGLDHDTEYIELIKKINENFKFDNIIPQSFSFGDSNISKVDVVVMCALYTLGLFMYIIIW